jgi:hypothetical protein
MKVNVDLKALGRLDYVGFLLKFGDKILLGLAALIFGWCGYVGVRGLTKVPDVSPSDLKQTAETAEKRVMGSQFTDDLLKKEGLENPRFAEVVAKLADVQPVVVSGADLFFRYVDFGGILRDQPTIFAPEKLYAAADRGGLLLYEVDAAGKLVEATASKEGQVDTSKQPRRAPARPRRQRRAGRMSNPYAGRMGGMGEMGYGRYPGMGGTGYPGMGGMGGGYPGRGGGYPGMGAGYPGMGGGYPGMMGGYPGMEGGEMGGPAPVPPTPRGRRSETEPQDSKRLAGPAPAAAKQEEQPTVQQPPLTQYTQTVEGHRWVVITAVYPHRKQIEEYLHALKSPEAPRYKEVKVERRELQADGRFSDWTPVDPKVTALMLTRIGWGTPAEQRDEEDPRLAPYLAPGLVAALPKLMTGSWRHVDHPDALKAALEAPAQAVAFLRQPAQERQQGAQEGPGAQGGSATATPAAVGPVGYPGGATASYPEPGMAGTGYPGAAMGPVGMPYGAMGYGMGGYGPTGSAYGAPRGSAAHETAAAQSAVEYLMIRFLDYTIKPGRTYQYRLKVVVENPNFKLVDLVADESYARPPTLEGPWSAPTEPVYVGKDLEYYLVGRSPRNEAEFEVHRWHEPTGDWYLQRFRIFPGHPIGSKTKVKVLTWDGQIQQQDVDFSTGAVMLDVVGGTGTFEESGRIYAYEEPVQALVVTPEGDLIWRMQIDDMANPIRQERRVNFEELEKLIQEQERQEKGQAATTEENLPPTFGPTEGTGDRIPGRSPERRPQPRGGAARQPAAPKQPSNPPAQKTLRR